MSHAPVEERCGERMLAVSTTKNPSLSCKQKKGICQIIAEWAENERTCLPGREMRWDEAMPG
jgi:hypothetical protein